MSSSSHDAPVLRLPTAGFAATGIVREFPQARRGYDQEEVAAHLRRVADHVIELQSRIADLEAVLHERENVEPQLEAARNDAYQDTAARIADMVRAFDEHIARLRDETESEIEQRLAEAREKADRMTRDAERTLVEAEMEAARVVGEASGEVERARTQAEEEAREVVEALQARRAAVLENVRRIQEGLGRTLQSVDAMLQASEDVVILEEPRDP
jgi:DivIVA domain-containing protein